MDVPAPSRDEILAILKRGDAKGFHDAVANQPPAGLGSGIENRAHLARVYGIRAERFEREGVPPGTNNLPQFADALSHADHDEVQLFSVEDRGRRYVGATDGSNLIGWTSVPI